MPGNQSFDITTGCDLQEVDNAVNQASKEIHQRYDFKGLKVSIELRRLENKLVMSAPDGFQKWMRPWTAVEPALCSRTTVTCVPELLKRGIEPVVS